MVVLSIGFTSANGQNLTNYVRKHKAEVAERQRVEREAYESACLQGTMEALKAFVNKYPNSKYVSDANAKLRSLELKIEKDAYSAACKTGTLEAFRDFLSKYPQSEYVQDIKNRIADFNQWSAAKEANTIQAYNNYLQTSSFKTFAEEARLAIDDINAVSEWQRVKTTNNLSEVEAYIKKHPTASCMADVKKKEHELKGVQFYNNGNFASAYREFSEAGGKYAISFSSREMFDRCQEYHEYSLLSSYSKESDLNAFTTKYPNSQYSNQVSNWIAIAKAKQFSMYTADYTYRNALSYAKDDATRNQVKSYYEAKRREYSAYKKEQRRIKWRRDGGIVNFGIELIDLGINPSSYDDYDSSIDYVAYYNVGLGIKVGNYKSPVQFEVGAKPGLAIYTLWYGSDDETKTRFHMPLYARLKIGLVGGSRSK